MTISRFLKPARVGLLGVTALVVLTAAVAIQSASPAAAAGTYANGFSEQVITDQLSVPTGMRFAPDGRIFVIEKGAFDRPVADIKVIKNGQVSTFATIPNVASDNERGLLGLVLDPDFATNRYVYIAYTGTETKNKVTRLQASATNPDVAAVNGDGTPAQTLLLGNIPSPTGIHQVGELQFGKDGKLYIPAGDGAIDSQAAQNKKTLGGKILRINKDGSVPTDNPFVGAGTMRCGLSASEVNSGDCQEIWTYGIRNSFTSDIDSVTGYMFYNDVGQDHWEEINRIDNAKGGNFGWRNCEGLYVGGTGARCSGYIDPLYAYNHYNGAVVGRSVSGGAFYRGSLYPADYNGDYFFADYVAGFIKKLDYGNIADTSDNVVTTLATGLSNVVNIETGPDGRLYYVDIDLNNGGGRLVAINYGSAPPPPPPPTSGPNTIKVFAAGTPAGGVYPTAELLINDQVVATFTNVQGNPGARQFTEYSYTHPSSVTAGQVKVRFPNDANINGEDRNLYVDKINIGGTDYQSEDPSVLSTGTWKPDTGCAPGNKQDEVLSCGGFFQYAGGSGTTNQTPAATITAPAEGTVYRAGETINFAGSASDPEDGDLPASAYTWRIIFHHGTHDHPINTFAGVKSGSFTPDTVGHTASDVYYRIQLTVTDSAGATRVVNREVQPQKSQISLQTSPAGLTLDLDGQQVTAPSSTVSVVGVQRELNAPLTQTANGKNYEFVSWSDNGAARHTISTSPDNTTYTATYREVGGTTPPPSSTVVEAETLVQPTGSGQNFTDANASAGTGKLVWSNAAATGQVTTPAAGKITVRARGDQCNGAPQMAVKLDGTQVMLVPVAATTWTDYSVDTPVSAGTHALSIAFTNDFKVTGGCDRNLRLDKVTFSGTGSEPPPPPSPTTGSNVKIYAAGKPAGGIYPTMQLLVNGGVVQTYADVRGNYDGAQYVEYSYASPTTLSLQSLRVQYSNDATVGTEDRNLRVDRVVLDGVTQQIEAPSVYTTYTGGCTSGYRSNEKLFCNGFFSF